MENIATQTYLGPNLNALNAKIVSRVGFFLGHKTNLETKKE